MSTARTAAADPLAALLDRPHVREVMAAVGGTGDGVWLVGGCVRDALLGAPVGDIDLATQALPETVMERAKAAGFKAIPTGIEHGTITVVVEGTPLEVTTLRKDVETDGRRAVVAFSRDLADDAQRRDFTMNALYVDRDGVLHDPTGGQDDLSAGRVRFIGEAGARIAEDYLRILRFFRFYARFGNGAPDRAAIRAIVSGRNGLTRISAERIWAELRKILMADNAGRSLLWMRQTGVYQIVLPESPDMDLFARFQRVEAGLFETLGIGVNVLTRLMALMPLSLDEAGLADRLGALARRLKLSNDERQSLLALAAAFKDASDAWISDPAAMRLALYRHGFNTVVGAAMLFAARAWPSDPQAEPPEGSIEKLSEALDAALDWEVPSLPVSGKDLLERGISAGPQLGAALKVMEGAWVASDFTLDRDALLAVLKSSKD